MSRSPIALLGAVVDEVEGLRRTDSRSFLPEALIREMRVALGDVPGTVNIKSGRAGDVESLVGQTVSHVFSSNLRRGDYVVLCTDGSFVVLEAENDGDSAYVYTNNYYGSISEYLKPAALCEAGFMTPDQRDEAEKQERIAHAEKVAARARADVISAEAMLTKLKTPPVVASQEGGAA